jgi:hypothetical protein
VQLDLRHRRCHSFPDVVALVLVGEDMIDGGAKSEALLAVGP